MIGYNFVLAYWRFLALPLQRLRVWRCRDALADHVLRLLFFTWIRFAGNKLEHHSAMIQIVRNICSAYGSFIWAEGVFHMGGVLATVASSLFLARHMWPHIGCPDSIHVWHMFETLGNITIFFLQGP